MDLERINISNCNSDEIRQDTLPDSQQNSI